MLVSQAVGSGRSGSFSLHHRCLRSCDWSSEGEEGVVSAAARNSDDHKHESHPTYGGHGVPLTNSGTRVFTRRPFSFPLPVLPLRFAQDAFIRLLTARELQGSCCVAAQFFPSSIPWAIGGQEFLSVVH